jgi:peroxiredoxin
MTQRQTETLAVGSQAPSFTLTAANREGQFLLQDLIARGPLILEFLRGTW